MAPRLEYHGVGAVVSALMRFIHPSEHIRNKYPNPLPSQRLENCTTIHQEVKNVSRRDQLTLVVHHEEFKHADGTFIELYTVKRYWKVHQSGHPDYFFDKVQNQQENEDETEDTLVPEAVDEHLNGEIHTTQTITALVNVVDVDDDNEPSPENIPQPNDAVLSPLKETWGHSGFCYQRAANMQNHKANLNFHINNEDDYYLQLFEGMFPKDVFNTIIEGVNKEISGDPITDGELLHWIGLWVMMSTVAESDRRTFWSTRDLDIFEGSFFTLSNYMTRTRFENILNNLTYMNKKPPEFRDRFWEVRDMLDCWNSNMANNFEPSWINCIDESMSKWVNEYTCPGFMFVP